MFEKQGKHYADWRDKSGKRLRKSFTSKAAALQAVRVAAGLVPRKSLASLAPRSASQLVPAPSRGGLRALRVDARARSTRGPHGQVHVRGVGSTPRVLPPAPPSARLKLTRPLDTSRAYTRALTPLLTRCARAPLRRAPADRSRSRLRLGLVPRSRRCAAQASRWRAQRGSRWATRTAHTGTPTSKSKTSQPAPSPRER